MILELYTDIKQTLLFRVGLFVCTIQIYDQRPLFFRFDIFKIAPVLAVRFVEVVSLFGPRSAEARSGAEGAHQQMERDGH